MSKSFLLLSTATAVALGCVGQTGGSPPGALPSPAAPAPTGPPEGWDRSLRLPAPMDLNPDPNVVEVNLEARVQTLSIVPGTSTPLWTYDGSVPGPLIRVRAGDRLIVNFRNQLPEATTIHWHGLRIPVEMDGVPGHSAPVVPPGGSFRYEFTVPDAGLYWYHPHFHSAAQLGNGLYGTLLVEDPAEPAGLGDEIVLQLSDIGVDPEGRLDEPDIGGNLGTLFGREGALVLVNGRQRPTLLARAGRRQRWRLVNSARARYFQIAMDGHRFLRIGGDGGLIAEPVESERLLLIPGERADVLVVPQGDSGEEIPVRWVAYDRGYGTAFMRPDVEIMRLRLVDGAPEETAPRPQVSRTIAPLDLAGATPVQIDFTRNDMNGKFALGINHRPAGTDEPFEGHIGETQVWTVGNKVEWDHPFHMHGFFFQVLGDDGRPLRPLEWKDTVNVPVNKTVRVAIRYDDRPGMWMFHCHILDHADAGMMGMLHLMPAGHR